MMESAKGLVLQSQTNLTLVLLRAKTVRWRIRYGLKICNW
jgi:hypothetical protein